MNLENFERSLCAMQRRVPFRLFVVELMSGDRIEVDHPEALVLRSGVAVYIMHRVFPPSSTTRASANLSAKFRSRPHARGLLIFIPIFIGFDREPEAPQGTHGLGRKGQAVDQDRDKSRGWHNRGPPSILTKETAGPRQPRLHCRPATCRSLT